LQEPENKGSSSRLGSAKLGHEPMLPGPVLATMLDEPIALSWSAPAEGDCTDAAYVLGEIRRHIGPARPDRKPIRASVVIRRAGATSWQMDLKTEQGGTEGERTIRDSSCAAISDAAVVVLAWMIDPDAMSEQSRPAAPSPSSPPPSPEPPPKPVPSAPPVSPREPISPFVGISIAGDAGTLPTASSGAELRLGAALRPVRTAAYGAYWPSSSKTIGSLTDGRQVGGTFSLMVLGLEACFDLPIAPRPDAASFAICAGPELDRMHARSFGVNAPGEGIKTWVSATGGVEAAVPLSGPWRLSVRLAGVFPQRREHFALQGVGEVHQPALVGGRAALGIQVVF
jgi:hypothetical protein